MALLNNLIDTIFSPWYVVSEILQTLAYVSALNIFGLFAFLKNRLQVG